MSRPLVSVIIPTYGDDDLVRDALDSVRNQTYDPIEIVIVDSSDVGWLAQLAEGQGNLEYEYQPPEGISAARNRGIEIASGDVIAWLDADDRWLPQKIEKQVERINRGAEVVYTDAFITQGEERWYQKSLDIANTGYPHLEFLREGGVPFSSVAMGADTLVETRFDTELRTAEDRHLLVRLFRSHEGARVPEALVEYTRREGSLSDDSEQLYRDELHLLNDLAGSYPEVEEVLENLRAKAQYKHGKRSLRDGNAPLSRRMLFRAVLNGYRDVRAIALLIISMSPMGHARLLRTLEKLNEKRKK